MRIGVAKEIKAREYRVALTPAGEAAGGERGSEERRVVVRAAAHVVEGQPFAFALPTADIDAGDRRVPVAAGEIGWPADPDAAEAEPQRCPCVV